MFENDKYRPTKAQFLAELLQGSASYSSSSTTIQRSHRFPMHLFIQIENMARVGNVPVSLIINQLLECGLDAVMQELPEEIGEQVIRVQKDQLERKTVDESVEVKQVGVAKVKVQRTK